MKLRIGYDWRDFWVGLRWNGTKRHLTFGALGLQLTLRFHFRVLCGKCAKPATMICVHADGWGASFNRDPLCIEHGVALGPCPDDTPFLPLEQRDKHVPIVNIWYFDGGDR